MTHHFPEKDASRLNSTARRATQNTGTFASRPALKSDDRRHARRCRKEPHRAYRRAADCACRGRAWPAAGRRRDRWRYGALHRQLPETDRAISARQIQARAAEASEQLVEKTKALGVPSRNRSTSCRRCRSRCRASNACSPRSKMTPSGCPTRSRTLTGAIDNLRQSFASAQSSDTSAPIAAGQTRQKPAAGSTRPRARSASGRSRT